MRSRLVTEPGARSESRSESRSEGRSDGRSDGAIAHFKRAVELAPGNVTMEDNLRKSLLTKEKERPPCEP